MICIRDTFYIVDNKEYLHFVISIPDENRYMLIVNASVLNKTNKTDNSCILEINDHPLIKRTSFIDYAHTFAENKKYLDILLKDNILKKGESISKDILEKIQNGARKTDALPNKFKRFYQYF